MSDTEPKNEHEQPAANPETKPKKPAIIVDDGDHKVEVWIFFSVFVLFAVLVCWALVFAKLGNTSVWAHSAIIPTLGVLTVPLMAWGLLRALFRPPALRKSRVAGFGILMMVGLIANVPIIAPPLSTDDNPIEDAMLPMKGLVYVSAGGDEPSRNYHATTAGYRWGIDFTKRENGRKVKTDGQTPEDFYCFGTPVYAPVSGRVVEAENAEADNPIGEVSGSPDTIFGNYLVIETPYGDTNAYVFVGQMMHNSVPFAIGDSVQAGSQIGRCGNSGRSIEPHVHVHAQTTPNFPFTESVPLHFKWADGSGVPNGPTEWGKGDGDELQIGF